MRVDLAAPDSTVGRKQLVNSYREGALRIPGNAQGVRRLPRTADCQAGVQKEALLVRRTRTKGLLPL